MSSSRRHSTIQALLTGLTAVLAIGGAKALDAQGPPQGLPPQASQVAQEVVVEGELEVRYEDSPTGGRLLHFLNTPAGKLSLTLNGPAPGWLTDTHVRAHGRLQNNTLALSSSSSVQALSLPTVNTFGVQNTLVMLINFQDDGSQPYTASDASAVTFQTTNNYYLEASYGQTSLAGRVMDWTTLPTTSGGCATDNWASLADAAAQKAGINLANYPRRIYAFPQNSSCAWWGMGSVGGNPSRVWVNGSYALQVVGHEFGHNLGLYHAHSLPCDPSGCAAVEYGDDHDIMGNLSTGHMNAFQKERLGWLNYGISPPIQSVTASGDFHIDPMEPAGSVPKALKILKSTDSSGLRTFYYVELRTQAGFDGGLAPGVIVHTGYEADGNSSYEIDLDPITTSFDSILDPGQALDDATASVTITADGFDATGALVNVAIQAAPCSEAAPNVSLSPGTTVSAAAGASVAYSMSIRNNDSSTCSAATFGTTSLVPSGWTGTFGAPTVSLSPGASTTTPLTVISPTSASGMYSFQAGAMRSGPTGTTSDSINIVSSYVVTLSTSSSGGVYQINATVRANSAAASGANVNFVIVDSARGSRTLSATTNASGVASVKFRPKHNDPSGTYSVTATATLGTITGSATGSFVVR